MKIISILGVLVHLITVQAVGQAQKNKEDRKAQETFVLIHGAWHGSWAWTKLIPLLEAKGHRVIAVDLPGRGGDTSLADLQGFTNKVVRIIEQQSVPVILVGHSMGGLTVETASEAIPAKIKKAVYLAAFLIPPNKSYTDMLPDSGSLTNPLLRFSKGMFSLDTTGIRKGLIPEGNDEDIAFFQRHLVPEPLQPVMAKQQLTAERFGKVPRYYIQTMQDKVVSATFQNKMFTAVACKKVISINTGHSVFWSQPQLVADILLNQLN